MLTQVEITKTDDESLPHFRRQTVRIEEEIIQAFRMSNSGHAATTFEDGAGYATKLYGHKMGFNGRVVADTNGIGIRPASLQCGTFHTDAPESTPAARIWPIMPKVPGYTMRKKWWLYAQLAL